jgi:site-specific DNA-cytosine methylase
MDAQSLRMVRTEEGKALRKAYESGEIHHGFNEHRTAEPRTDGVSNAITTVQKDNLICETIPCAMRGRNPDNPSDRSEGIPTEQRLELQEDNICNCLTSVQKDSMILEIKRQIDERYHPFIYEIDGEYYLIRIRKLTPRETWRLMDFSDEDFDKAQAVNSNTQLYKQSGNSIVRTVLMAIFKQLIESEG